MADGKILFTNNSGGSVSVAFNIWKKDGDGDPGTFTVPNGATEAWGRKDTRGYVMYVTQGSDRDAYYVLSGSVITYSGLGSVIVNGKKVDPVTAPAPFRTEEYTFEGKVEK